MIEYYADKDIRVLLLINPDNPSGNFVLQKDVLRLALWCRERSIYLIVDESFIDFAEDGANNSLLQNDILASNLYLIIVKSISKSYGVPGLRLGILACGDIELIERIRKDLPIWNINSFAEFYMQIFGKYESDYKKACGRFISERKRFYQNLQRVDFYVLFLHKLIIFV